MIKIYFLKKLGLKSGFTSDFRNQLILKSIISIKLWCWHSAKEKKDDFDLDFRGIDGDAIASEVAGVLFVGHRGEGGDHFGGGLNASVKGRDEDAVESER